MNTISYNSILGLPLNIPSNSRGGICISCLGHSSPKLSQIILFADGHNGASLETKTSRYFWRSLKFLQGKVRSRNGPRVQFGRGNFPQNNVVLSLFTRLCKEGLHLYICSVFFAVISGVCLLAWYGQEKAKNLIEKKLLPSVCSIISEHIQREVNFGKVHSISPLGITIESCTIGPHKEEFSCAELPSLKLRFHPFASLRKGKIVIDAVLSHPTVLVAQKEDYTWLGVPAAGRVYQRRLSVDEGIDYRTRVQRIHREEAGARWTRERVVAARKAAETGYFVRDHCSEYDSLDECLNSRRLKETTLLSENSFAYGGYQHCMDGVDGCHMKHSSSEKPFGINVHKLGFNLWPGILPWHPKHMVKRNTNWKDLSAGTAATKRFLLERSSCMAINYFHGVLDGSNNNPYWGRNSVYGDNVSEKFADNCSSYEAREDSGKQNTIVSNMDELNNGVKEIAETLEHNGGGTFSDSETNLDLEHHDLKSDHNSSSLYNTQALPGEEAAQAESVKPLLPVVLQSLHLKGGTLMMLAYGDREAREIQIVSGQVNFLDHYSRFYAHLEGNCKKWRSDVTSENGGSLSVDVFVDTMEQRWHVNLKVASLFVPLFERILEIPISWLEGRASGEIHICMSKNETFPSLHGQLEVAGLCFQIQEAPACFTNCSATLLFRGQRIFLHNASGLFGNVHLEASGDFGIHPEEGEFHIMCQVPCVEVNTLLRTFKMRPLLFPAAGSVSAIFNCQGPLDAPIFVGSSMISRKIHYCNYDASASLAYEAVNQNKDSGAVAAFDRIPFSYLSANYTFSTDSCVADLYGIRACLVDGGEIRGAGNMWMCPEGEIDDSAIDVNLSGSLFLEKILSRYIPGYKLLSVNLGDLNGEAKLSGSLLRPRFDIKWVAPRAEGSFSDARGDIIISHDNIVVNSSSEAFELCSKFLTSYLEVESLKEKDSESKISPRLLVTGIELDLHMHGFDLLGLLSFFPIDSPKAVYLKSTGRIKFQGKIRRQCFASNKAYQVVTMTGLESTQNLVGDVTISGLKLNQLLVAPHLIGSLSFSDNSLKLDATGRPDEKVRLEIQGPFKYNCKGNLFSAEFLSFSLRKGPLEAHLCYRPLLFGSLEVRHLPLDELELGSLRGTIQRAEIQLNFQKRRGHGVLSVLKPKFSGVLGEVLDLAARWSGDVVTIEKTVLEQSCSRYEFQGEYVFPGVRDRVATGEEKCNLLKKAMAGHLGSAISSMGRWRLRLEVPQAEVAEMLPLARLLSRSIDPSVRSRSKDIFIQRLHSMGLYSERILDLLEVIQGHCTQSDDVFVLEDANLPGLTELRGSWRGSLVASGGGNGDTVAEFDLHGDDWEWGTYKTQRVLAIGAYSSDDGLHLEKVFVQMDNATIHGDGTLLGLQTNFHFAVLNFPVGLVPMFVQVIESSTVDAFDALKTLLAPIKGILHMEGDLSGSFARPECDVKVRLLDGAVGGIDLGRAEIVASVTRSSRFNFNARIEPAIQSGHVHVQGSVPLTFMVSDLPEDKSAETYGNGSIWIHNSNRERTGEILDESVEKKAFQDRNEEGWDIQMSECLKGLNCHVLDSSEVRGDADIKDGGMMLLTALFPYASWLSGSADIILHVRGSIERPILDGSAYFHRASVSSPVLWKPLTNFGGTVHVVSSRLCINSLEGRVGRRGKLFIRGNIPLRTSEGLNDDKVDVRCDVLEVRARNIISGQVDTQMLVTGSILKPNICGKIQLSHGEVYLPHDKNGRVAPFNRLVKGQTNLNKGGYNDMVGSRYVSRFFGSHPGASSSKLAAASGEHSHAGKAVEQESSSPMLEMWLSDLKLVLGPELRIIYPLILNFAVSGEVELNGFAGRRGIKPKGVLTFENGDVNLVATQVRLKREHLNVAKFEPDNGLDPVLDLALVGSEWQLKIRGRASNWQDNLVVTSTHSGEQDVLSASEAARVFESQLAESILEGDGQLAFKKLATSTLERLMPRIEGKGKFGQARWRLVYAPQIPTLVSMDPCIDPLKSIASNISFGTEVEVHLGKRLQASIVRQMKDSEMAMQWTLIYQLTSRLRVVLQSAPSKRLLFEYSATSQD